MSNLKKYNSFINESINVDNVNDLITKVKNMVKAKTLETKKKIDSVKIYYTIDGVKINTEDLYFMKSKLNSQRNRINNKISVLTIKITDVSSGLTSLPYNIIAVDGDNNKSYSGEDVINVVDFNPKGGESITKGTILGKYIVSKQENIKMLHPNDEVKEEPNTVQPEQNKQKSTVNDSDTIKQQTDKIIDLVKNTPKENLGDLRTNCMKSITVVDNEIKKIQKIENYSNIPLIVKKIDILNRNRELLEDVLKQINIKIDGSNT